MEHAIWTSALVDDTPGSEASEATLHLRSGVGFEPVLKVTSDGDLLLRQSGAWEPVALRSEVQENAILVG